MKKLLLLSTLLLTACNTTNPNLITTKFTVVMPDESFYNCPSPKKFANSKTLTDVQVAKTIVELYKNNKTCKTSIDAIHKFLEDSKTKIESEKQLVGKLGLEPRFNRTKICRPTQLDDFPIT